MNETPVDAESIAIAAGNPQSATVDGKTVTAVSIPDQIAAAKFAAANPTVSGARTRRKIGMDRIIPPGAADC